MEPSRIYTRILSFVIDACICGGCFIVMRRNIKIKVVLHRLLVTRHLHGAGIVHEISVCGLHFCMRVCQFRVK